MRLCIRLVSVLLVSLICFVPFSGKAGKTAFHEDPDAVEKAALSVLMLTVFDSKGQPFATGSGFVMFDNRTLVTNYHVIEDGAYVIAISDDSDKYYIDEVCASDKKQDDKYR